MVYTVSTADTSKIILNETSYVDSVLQNIRCLLSTWQGDVPLYRDYGIDPTLLHKPINEVESLLVECISDQIEKYEPRAELLNVDFFAQPEKPDVLGITVQVEVSEDE